MEKRRRARINRCLNELKSLILDAMKKDPARHSKLEKADILEMTVKHLQSVQRQQLSIAVSTDPAVLHKFKNGFSECATEVGRYIDRLEGVETSVKRRLVSHLTTCVTGLKQISPQHRQQQQQQRENCGPGLCNPASIGYHAGNSGRSIIRQMTALSEDVNNNNHDSAGGARLQTMTGLQLIPSRLPNGELALLVPNSQELPQNVLPFFQASMASLKTPEHQNHVSTTTDTLMPSVMLQQGVVGSGIDTARSQHHHSAFTAVGRAIPSTVSSDSLRQEVRQKSPLPSPTSSITSSFDVVADNSPKTTTNTLDLSSSCMKAVDTSNANNTTSSEVSSTSENNNSSVNTNTSLNQSTGSSSFNSSNISDSSPHSSLSFSSSTTNSSSLAVKPLSSMLRNNHNNNNNVGASNLHAKMKIDDENGSVRSFIKFPESLMVVGKKNAADLHVPLSVITTNENETSSSNTNDARAGMFSSSLGLSKIPLDFSLKPRPVCFVRDSSPKSSVKHFYNDDSRFHEDGAVVMKHPEQPYLLMKYTDASKVATKGGGSTSFSPKILHLDDRNRRTDSGATHGNLLAGNLTPDRSSTSSSGVGGESTLLNMSSGACTNDMWRPW